MNDRYTITVLDKADRLQQNEYAALALMQEDHTSVIRTALAAALAALMTLYPAVSAAAAALL